MMGIFSCNCYVKIAQMIWCEGQALWGYWKPLVYQGTRSSRRVRIEADRLPLAGRLRFGGDGIAQMKRP